MQGEAVGFNILRRDLPLKAIPAIYSGGDGK